jgi:hypothetical protein
VTCAGSVVWIVPYECDSDHQHSLNRQNSIVQQKTLQDCFQRLIAAYSRINALEGFESQAAVSNLHLEEALGENAELKRRLKLRDVPPTRCFGVQANTNADNSDSVGAAAAAAATQAVRHATSIVHSELASAMASASQLIGNLEQKLTLKNQHIAHQDQHIADLLLQLEAQKEHSWRQLRLQEDQYEQRVAALTTRISSSDPVHLSLVSPSSEAAAAAALSAAKEEIVLLQSSLAKEMGGFCDY